MENLDFNRSHGSCRVAAAWHPATDGNPWVAAMGEQLVRGSGAGAGMWQWHGSVGVGGAVLLGNVEL